MARVENTTQLFDNLCGEFLPEKAGDLDAVIQFKLTGDDGGDWWVKIADSTCNVEQGEADDPTMTLTAEASDWLAIVNGDLNAVGAFMQGKVKVAGDMGLAMKMQNIFSI